MLLHLSPHTLLLYHANHPPSGWFAKRLFPVGIKRFAPLFAEAIDSTEKTW